MSEEPNLKNSGFLGWGAMQESCGKSLGIRKIIYQESNPWGKIDSV